MWEYFLVFYINTGLFLKVLHLDQLYLNELYLLISRYSALISFICLWLSSDT